MYVAYTVYFTQFNSQVYNGINNVIVAYITVICAADWKQF